MSTSKNNVLVGILVGSESDLPTMKQTLEVLSRLEIPAELLVRSAHRTPDEALDYARTARQRGLKVIVAAAGMAAHLAGAMAANTTLPVIGVPLSAGALNGVDALYSTVQMPPGIPVACVAVDGAVNAAYLAAQILAIDNTALAERLAADRAVRREKILGLNA